MANDALSEATVFLEPVVKREAFAPARGQTVIDRIFDNLSNPVETGETKADRVVDQALDQLEHIQQSLAYDPALAKESLDTSTTRRTIDGLLDLISLEGIYPRLLPGVGAPIERRVQSLLQGGFTVTDNRNGHHDEPAKLQNITHRLCAIISVGTGLAPAIEQRTLVDVLAASYQLAFGPEAQADKDFRGHQYRLTALLENQAVPVLYPALISLVHPNTPSWLKPHVTHELSLLPQRKPDGVRQTITFVAKATPQRPKPESQRNTTATEGPVLPLEVLVQISKVLSAVPSTLSPEEWFKRTGPQLLQLLVDQDPDAARAAAYTISHGILRKRQFGPPGAAGWQAFIQPLIEAINPTLLAETQQGSSSSNDRNHKVTLPIRQLASILLTFPNPGLAKRSLSPCILELWHILCSSKANSQQYTPVRNLLSYYINSVTGHQGLKLIADNLMYSGPPRWVLASDWMHPQAQPSLHREMTWRCQDSRAAERWASYTRKFVSDQTHIRTRIETFFEMIDRCNDNKELSLFFADILQRTLNQPSDSHKLADSSRESQAIVHAGIARELITRKAAELMSEVGSILPVIQLILQTQISNLKLTRSSADTDITLSSFASIVQDSDRDKAEDSDLEDVENSLSLCLPWLVLALQSQDDASTRLSEDQLASMQALLENVLYIPRISRSSKDTTRILLSLLRSNSSGSQEPTSGSSKQAIKDLELFTQATANLQAPEIPVRVQGLSQLETLIKQDSALVSISSATLTVLALLQDADSFVYLSGVRILVLLAKKGPKSTLRTLEEAFQDIAEQSTVDVRLKIGEALQSVIEEIGETLPAVVNERLVTMLLFVASRRVHRPQTQKAQEKATAIPRTGIQESEIDNESDEETQDLRTERDLQTILDHWQGRSGAEDLRIRASALSILGTCFERVLSSSMISFWNPAFEIVMNILTHERGQENAIIRRSAVLLVLSIVKSQDNVDKPNGLSTATTAENALSLNAVSQMLQSTAVEDDDKIVRGHAENVIQAIKDWQSSAFDRLLHGQDIRFGLEDENGETKLRGLEVDPTTSDQQGKGKIEEIE